MPMRVLHLWTPEALDTSSQSYIGSCEPAQVLGTEFRSYERAANAYSLATSTASCVVLFSLRASQLPL